MAERPKIDDSLLTIPEYLINQLVVDAAKDPRRYTPSEVARILSLNIPNQQDISPLTKGTYSHRDPMDTIMTLPSAEFDVLVGRYTIQLKGMSFPGLTYGEELMAVMDRKYHDTPHRQKLTLAEKYHFAAFLTLLTATTHPFGDANGRVSVGEGDFYLRRYAQRKLDYQRLYEARYELGKYGW